MDMNLILLIICSFILGLTAKYADLVNEHGLKEHFRGAGILSGYLWGLCGVGIILSSPLASLTYVAHILYWFWRVKLEYSNHAIAGVIMLLSAFFLQGEFLFEYRWHLVCIFFAYLITGYIQTYFKEKYPASASFWRLRIRIYLIPFLYSLYTQNWDPIIATCFGMIGCEWITLNFREYWNDLRKPLNKLNS